MAYMFLGGNRVRLNPAIPGVDVHIGVMLWGDPGQYHVSGGRTIDNGITITVDGTEPHVLQLVSRQKFVGNEYSSETYTAPGNRKGTFSQPASRIFHLDAKAKESPYFDAPGNGTCVRETNSVTIFDQPTIEPTRGEDDILHLPSEGDWTAMIALSYCITNRGLLGIVRWSVKRTFVGKTAYQIGSICPVGPNLIKLGHGTLTEGGYGPPDHWLPNHCINPNTH
jgi:hypothetical protein